MSDAAGVASASVLEPLMPLVRAGYKSLAGRAAEGLRAWYSAFSPEARALVSGKLALLNLAGAKPVPKLYAPSQSSTSGLRLYVATGGGVQQRTVSAGNSLLEDCVSGALTELSELADGGEVAAISRDSFGMLFFAFDYGTFQQKPTLQRDLEFALGIAISHYRSIGGGKFVEQLAALVKLQRIRISPSHQGFDYTEDGTLSSLTFNIADKASSMLNIVLGIRLLYLAATAVLGQPTANLPELRRKVIEATGGPGLSGNTPAVCSYLVDDSNLQSVSEQLDKVALHKGVEQIIAGSNKSLPELEHVLNVLRLTKLLDTIRTGKVALGDSDKPYSDAIGLAELIG